MKGHAISCEKAGKKWMTLQTIVEPFLQRGTFDISSYFDAIFFLIPMAQVGIQQDASFRFNELMLDLFFDEKFY